MERSIQPQPESEWQGPGSRQGASKQRTQPRKPPLREPTVFLGESISFFWRERETEELMEGFGRPQLLPWLLGEEATQELNLSHSVTIFTRGKSLKRCRVLASICYSYICLNLTPLLINSQLITVTLGT